MSSSAAEDLEASQPLLDKTSDNKDVSYKATATQPDFEKMFADLDNQPPIIQDPMSYNLTWLKSFATFGVWDRTVWDNPPLWAVMRRLMTLALVIAVLAYNVIPDPTLLDASKFSEISRMLSLFVTMMLAFFLSTSVNRWIHCVTGFLNLFNSVRNLAMQLHTLGVPRERIDICMRYGVLSAKFLVHELRIRKLPADKQKEATQALWKHLESGPSPYTTLLKQEQEILEPINDKAGQMWIWVGSLVGRMAMDGDVPPMASPTYGRIMGLAQSAQEGLRQVRTSIIVQMPFVYVHTLACLVHLNCILLVISMGLAIGVTTHGIRQYVHHYYYEEHPDPTIQVIPLTAQLQSLIVEFLKGILGPLLFQAFLEIAISVVSPFSDSDAAIPVSRLTASLETDLQQSFLLADKPPHWEKPTFKQPKKD
jgi:predicted membrane chloride channel (bestrophin family)